MEEILISADLGNPKKSDLLKVFRNLSKSAKIVFMYRTSKTICGKAFIEKYAVFFKIKSLEKCNKEVQKSFYELFPECPRAYNVFDLVRKGDWENYYCQCWDFLNYLKKENIIKQYKYPETFSKWK